VVLRVVVVVVGDAVVREFRTSNRSLGGGLVRLWLSGLAEKSLLQGCYAQLRTHNTSMAH